MSLPDARLRAGYLEGVRSLDTSSEAHAVQRAVFQAMTGEQRVLAALAMADEAREISMSGIRARRPELSDEQVRLEWLQLLHGREFVERLTTR
ncbi:MAG: hypothetical protein IPF42_12230 [Candidatus Microthrix sp.]|nr:hypothetical protein [Candidatus Microthrix sp.]MBP7594226.1 hypothetical protein [Candidatus Microthrix sp.]